MADAAELPEQQTERILTGLSRGRFGRIAPERIARHVMANSGRDAAWALRKAMFDALARRYGFAQRDELKVAGPLATHALGSYQTESPPSKTRPGPRPYDTALLALEPLRMSCACADFVRSSLGLCKHALVVLEALEQRGLLRTERASARSTPSAPVLCWAHEHPVRGSADRLSRLHVCSSPLARPRARIDEASLGAGTDSLAFTRALGLVDGRPTDALLVDVAQRLAFIVELERAVERGALMAEPAVPTLLREERARAERSMLLEPAVTTATASLATLSRTLYPYQQAGVQRFFQTGRLLLADDMGLGKTTQAIAACHGLFETQRIERGLLIVPAPLKSQWQREWEATTRAPLTVVEGSQREREQIYKRTTRGFLLIGYEQLLRDLTLVQGFGPEMVVLDEAQRIKNWATKSATYVKSLAPAYRLVLTGTPMENRFDELASIMDFVDDLALEPKWRLVPLHTLPQADGGKGIAGAQNLDLLRERLAGSMLRRVRREVLTQLPSRTDTLVPVELSELQREQHDDLRQPIGELAAKAARRALAPAEFLQLMQLLMKQRMICNGMAQVQFAEVWPRCETNLATPEVLASLFSPKLSVLRGLLEQIVLHQKRKAVVFSQWRNMLRLSEWAVRDLLASAGMRAVFFTGAESEKQRKRALAEFHDDPGVSVLFSSDAGGVGLNLQHAASCCVNLELPWNPAVLEQRIARIHRLGQALPVDVYNLVSEEGIEGRIAALLAQKQAVFASLFDGTSDEVRFDGGGSFLDGVKRLVEPASPQLLQVLAERVEEIAEEAPAAEPAAEQPAPSAPTPPSASPTVPNEACMADERSLLAGLVVTELADGGLRVEASAALASALADLVQAFARAQKAR